MAAGYTWTNQSAAGNRYWNSLASSSNGKYVAGATGTGAVLVSADYGTTWTDRTPPISGRFWVGITSSADGSHLALADGSPGDIWTSTNYGLSWTDQTNSGSNGWSSIAGSADGNRLLAVAYNGPVRLSTDGGATWSNASPPPGHQYVSASSSSTGQYLAVADQGTFPTAQFIFTSSDFGVTWNQQPAAGQRFWGAVGVSPDGSHMYAGDGTHLYYSADHGTSWSQASGVTGTPSFTSVSASTTGQYAVAVGNNTTPIYISSDFGVTWTQETTPTTLFGWNATAMSGDGSRLFVAGNNDGGGTDIWMAYNAALDSSLLVSNSSPGLTTSTSASTLQAPNTGDGAPVRSQALTTLLAVLSIGSVGVGVCFAYRRTIEA